MADHVVLLRIGTMVWQTRMSLLTVVEEEETGPESEGEEGGGSIAIDDVD